MPTSLVGKCARCSVVEITKLFDLDRAARPAKIQHPHGWWGWAATAPRSLASAHASDRGVEEGRLAVQGVTIAVGVLEKRPPIPSDFVGFV